MRLGQIIMTGLIRGLAICGALACAAASAAEYDADLSGVRPCIDSMKRALGDSRLAGPDHAELDRCYLAFEKSAHGDKGSFVDFAYWVGVTAARERMEDTLNGVSDSEPAAEERTGGAQSVTAYDLMRNYENNEYSADSRYKGKVYVIEGDVSDVREDSESGRTVVEIKGDNFGLFNVHAYVGGRDQVKARRLRKNDHVRLRGVIMGVILGTRVEVDEGRIIGARS